MCKKPRDAAFEAKLPLSILDYVALAQLTTLHALLVLRPILKGRWNIQHCVSLKSIKYF